MTAEPNLDPIRASILSALSPDDGLSKVATLTADTLGKNGIVLNQDDYLDFVASIIKAHNPALAPS